LISFKSSFGHSPQKPRPCDMGRFML
jgi:hypothetical protein